MRDVDGLEQGVAVDSPLADPPTVLSESTLSIPGELAPDAGRGLHAPLDLEGKSPVAFEAFADRYDLLR